MFKAKKAESTGGNFVKMDWKAIVDQVPEDVVFGYLHIIDLGVQDRDRGVYNGNKDDYMFALTEDDANDLIDTAEDVLGPKLIEKHDLDQFEDVDVTSDNIKEINKSLYFTQINSGVEKSEIVQVDEGDVVYKLPFRVVDLKPRQEVMYVADLPEVVIDYITEDGDVVNTAPYRINLARRDFKTKELIGTGYTLDSKTGKFDPKTLHVSIAKATRKDKELTDDISILVNQPVQLVIEKSECGKYIKDFSAKHHLQKIAQRDLDRGLPELPYECQLITFDDVTEEQLDIVNLGYPLIKKIKSAINYEGSNMQKVLEAWEAKRSTSTSSAKDDEDASEDDNTQDEDDTPETPKRRQRATKKGTEDKPNPKRTRRSAAKEEQPEDSDDDEDEDCPF